MAIDIFKKAEYLVHKDIRQEMLLLDLPPLKVFKISITRYTRAAEKQLVPTTNIVSALLPILSKILFYDPKERLWSQRKNAHLCPITRRKVAEFIGELIKYNSEGCFYSANRIKKIMELLEKDDRNFKKMAMKKWKNAICNGEGPHAVASCNKSTITLHKNNIAAKKYKNFIDEGGCCSDCKSYNHLMLNLKIDNKF